MSARTLLLVYIHGFQGDDHTFRDFPQHLERLIAESVLAKAHPSLRIVSEVFPAFETRGDLKLAVDNLRDWLLNRVVDLEVSNGTPSPTIAPSVRVILVGHSMGGIVAAECALGIVQDTLEEEIPLPGAPPAMQTEEQQRINDLPTNRTETHKPKGTGTAGKAMFPCIQGILAFDTPYLGISPGVIAHGAEEQFSQGRKWYEAASGLFAAGAAATASSASTKVDASKGLPAPEAKKPAPAPATAWQKWGKAAILAGAATTAIAGAGAAAWMGREHISSGMAWTTSHLAFVGTLARREELKRRMTAVIAELESNFDVGFANMYTLLGHGAAPAQEEQVDLWRRRLVGDERTFCVLPGKWNIDGKVVGERWFAAKNDKAANEVDAHCYMFSSDTNTGYESMATKARELVEGWISVKWLEDISG